MRSAYNLSFVAFILLLAGCASNPNIGSLTPQQRTEVSTIKILSGEPKRPYVKLGQVTGLSCNRNLYQEQDISKQEALQGIKIRTVLLGGDASIHTLCQINSDTDWANNCWASIKCIGEAVKFK